MPARPPHSVLIYPPIQSVAHALRIWTLYYSVNFPLALLRLGRVLRERGHRVTLLDAFHPEGPDDSPERYLTEPRIVRRAPLGNFAAEGRQVPVYRIGMLKDELVARLRTLAPVDHVYISSIFTWTWPTTHEVVALCKELFPRAEVHLGGIYPTLCPQQAATAGADDLHIGELAELASVWPDLSLAAPRRVDASILKTSLGCPNACTYCAVHVLEGRRMQYRDPDDVVAEIVALNREYGIAEFHFWESNLLLHADQHFIPLLDRIQATGLKLRLAAPEGVQTNLVDEPLARRMFAAGFQRFYLAVETTDSEWARRTHRPSGFAALQTAMQALHKAGFRRDRILCVLLVGQPGQTRRSVLRDILSVFALGGTVALLFYTLIPKTVDFERHADLIADRPLEDLDPLLFPFASPALTVHDMERLMRYFNFRSFPLDRIRRSPTADDLLCEAQDILRCGDFAH